MNEEQIKKHADKLEDILLREVEKRVNYHARIANLGIIKSMEVSAAVNCQMNGLPIEVVYVALIESIADWSRKIDDITGAPTLKKISKN